jgi:tetratricopeptide (TPR) repeat protein
VLLASLSAPAAPAVEAPALAPAALNAEPKASPASLPADAHEAALALARQGLLDSARAVSLKALATHPDDAVLLLLLGKLDPSGKESADYYKKAIKAGGSSPEAEEALFRLGQYTYATGKYHLAIPYFREYLGKYPDGGWRDPALYWMGNACLSLAQSRHDRTNYLDSGVKWFAKLLDGTKPADYYHPLALEGLAKAKAARGDREGAWQAVQAALEKAPEEEKPPLMLLAAQVRQGVDRAAEKSLMAQLVSRYPQSPEARYLRKLNSGADTSRWKSGPGLPRAAMPPVKDSLATASARRPDSSARAADAFELPPPHAPKDSAAKPPATAARPGPAAKDSSGGKTGGTAKPFTLQCGAFAQEANAQTMTATLVKLGLTPETVERDRAGKRIYQVRVGRFATAEEAEAFARDRLKPHRVLSQPVPVNP